MTYKIKLNIFEGPLDLLLFLIRKERIDIHDIPISKITEQYIEYIELMKLLDLDIAGEFLVMAATLMHIKSKYLLPPDEEEEDAVEEDPREELVKRLLEYKKYKEAARSLDDMRGAAEDMFLRRGAGVEDRVQVDGDGEYYEASLFDLINAFRTVLTKTGKKYFHEVVRDRFSVSDKIKLILGSLKNTGKVRFTELFDGQRTKDEVIATFLAVLEMIKMKDIMIVQKGFYGEIEIMENPNKLTE